LGAFVRYPDVFAVVSKQSGDRGTAGGDNSRRRLDYFRECVWLDGMDDRKNFAADSTLD
jgi:hypothetical protein